MADARRFRGPVDLHTHSSVSDGTQADHQVHQWVHEALLFQSHSDSEVSGLVGIPMQATTLRCQSETLNADAQV